MSVTVYQPDLLFADGALHAARSLAVDAAGRIVDPAQVPPDAQRVPLPGRALLPGLVNAHSHAFQRLIRGRTEYVPAGAGGDDFWSWRESMYRAAEALTPEQLYVASRQAFVEMALAGITAVGEFHYVQHQPGGRPYADPATLALAVVRAACDVGLRITLLRVGYARAGHGVAPNPRQARFLDPSPDAWLRAAEDLRAALRGEPLASVGLAPHSVRAVPRAWLDAAAGTRDFVVHMHVAEQPRELEACLAEHGLRPVELLERVGLLGPRFTAVHAVHLTPEEEGALGRAGARVCACPSTERNLGDGVVAADRLLAAGVRVCLGSDSQATVDLLDEGRQLEGHLRLVRLRRNVLDPGQGRTEGLAARLLDMATREGAGSLGLDTGALAAGRPADAVAVDLGHPALAGCDARTLLPALVLGGAPGAVRDVMVQGRWVVRGGEHALAAESGRAFAALSRELYG